MGSNVVALLKNDTYQKLIQWAKKSKKSPDVFLNILLDDEIERQRLPGISAELEQEESKQTPPSKKLLKSAINIYPNWTMRVRAVP